MDKCELIRTKLENWHGFKSVCSFMLNGNDGLPCDGEEKYREDVRHVQNCESCRAWVSGKIPPKEIDRMKRLKQYCCPVMYGAVEQEGYDEISLRLVNFQGDPVWAISNFDTVGGNLLVSYCPWCGTKMPKKQFVESGE